MISNIGFDEGYITLYVDEDTQKDIPVTITDNDTCGASAAGDKFCGILRGVRKDLGSVQVKGYAKMSYSGESAPLLGAECIVADGLGGVKAAQTGVNVIVTAVDEVAETVEFIF